MSSLKHKFRKTAVWVALGIIAYALHLILGKDSRIIEAFYSRLIFPLFRTAWDFTIGLSPIPLIYVFTTALLAWLIFRLWKVREKKRIKQKPNWKHRLAVFYLGLAKILGAGVFFFYLLWGFNYNRIPLEATLKLDVIPLDPHTIYKETEWALDRISEARKAIPGAGEGVLSAENFPKNLETEIRHSLTEALRSMGYPVPGRVRGRKLWPAAVLMRFGGSGIYLPWFFEGYTSSGLLPFSRPFNTAHEMSHGYGFTDEGSCNFLAWLACERSGNPAIQYSGRLAYWNYIAPEFRRAFPSEFKTFWQRLPTGTKADFQAAAENWRKYEGRLSQISEKVYSGYLKSQGIMEGILSYNRLLLLVTAWKDKYPLQ